MSDIGTCEVQYVDDRLVVVRADPHVRISRELLDVARSENYPNVSLDGDVFTIYADPPVRYRVVDDGNPRDVPASLVQEVPE